MTTVTLTPWEASPTCGPWHLRCSPMDGYNTARSPGTLTLPSFDSSQFFFSQHKESSERFQGIQFGGELQPSASGKPRGC